MRGKKKKKGRLNWCFQRETNNKNYHMGRRMSETTTTTIIAAALKTSVWGASAAFLSASFRHVLDDTNV